MDNAEYNPFDAAPVEPNPAAQTPLETAADVVEGGLNVVDLILTILSAF